MKLMVTILTLVIGFPVATGGAAVTNDLAVFEQSRPVVTPSPMTSEDDDESVPRAAAPSGSSAGGCVVTQTGKTANEWKESIVDVKAEYKDRWEELKDIHGRFMCMVNFWLTVLCTVVSLVGIVMPIITYFRNKDMRDVKEKINETQTCLEKTNMQLISCRVAASNITAGLVWTRFCNSLAQGNVEVSCIFEPLYLLIESLVEATQSGNACLLSKSVESVGDAVSQYREAVSDKQHLHEAFTSYIKNEKMFEDTFSLVNLTENLGRETKSLATILKFFNEFGIRMFGEVA